MTRLAAIACALALVTVPAFAPAAFPSDPALHALLQKLVDSQGIKGIVVGLLDESGTRRVIAHGDPGNGALPLDGDSVFEIGSMTKVFTGVLLADMVQRGEVELADPLADLLPPEVRVPARNGKQITLLDLTTHFSGLPHMPTRSNTPTSGWPCWAMRWHCAPERITRSSYPIASSGRWE